MSASDVLGARGRRQDDSPQWGPAPGTPGQGPGAYQGPYSGQQRESSALVPAAPPRSAKSHRGAVMRHRSADPPPESESDYTDDDSSYEHRRARKDRACNALPGRAAAIFALVACGAAAPLLFGDATNLFGDQHSLPSNLLSMMGMRGDPDEVRITRDPLTKRFGYVYNERLLLGASEDNTPAKAAGLSRYIGRQITHVNGVMVGTVQEFRDVESRVADTIALKFAPTKFVVGVPVRTLQRIVFQSGKVVESSAVGVVTRVPGETEGSVAEVKISGTRWDALPGQVEVVEMTRAQLSAGMPVRTSVRLKFQSGKVLSPGAQGVITKVPGDYDGSIAEVRIGGLRFDAMPGQLQPLESTSPGGTPAPATVATEEVIELLESLGHQNYLSKLVSFGMDRLDFLATAEEKDGNEIGVKPVHWRRIIRKAKQWVPASGRGREGLERLLEKIDERDLLPKLISWGFDRTDYLAKATAQDGESLGVSPKRWERILSEARGRVNETGRINPEGTPAPKESDSQQEVHKMLYDIGLEAQWPRVQAYGLDQIDRLAKAPNISATMELPYPVFARIQSEAKRRLRGEQGAMDPEVERQQQTDMHQTLSSRFEREDTREMDKLPYGLKDVAHQSAVSSLLSAVQAAGIGGRSGSVLEGIVGGAQHAESGSQWTSADTMQRLGMLSGSTELSRLQQEREALHSLLQRANAENAALRGTSLRGG